MKKLLMLAALAVLVSMGFVSDTQAQCTTGDYIYVGRDPQDLQRTPEPGQAQFLLKKDACVTVNSGSGHHTTKFLQAGNRIWAFPLADGSPDLTRGVWVNACGNDVLRFFDDALYVDSYQPAAIMPQRTPRVQMGQRVDTYDGMAVPSSQQPQQDGMSREEFLAALQVLAQGRAPSTSDRVWSIIHEIESGAGLFFQIRGYKDQQKILSALRNPLPVYLPNGGCGYGGGCTGNHTPVTPVSGTPCATCRVGGTRPPARQPYVPAPKPVPCYGHCG